MTPNELRRRRWARARALALALGLAPLGCGEEATVGGPDGGADGAQLDVALDAGCVGVGCCAQAADGTPCDDGDACTGPDRCAAGVCGGAEVCACRGDGDCPDPDGDRCTGVPYCDKTVPGHACRPNPSTVIACPDDEPCRLHPCDPASGQCLDQPRPAGSPCGGDAPCTLTACDGAGACVAGGRDPACACLGDGDCAAFEDADLCNGTLFCDKSSAPFACAVLPTSVVQCPPAEGPCLQRTCVPATGACVQGAKADLSACDDGLACTEGDHCQGGACVAGTSTCPCQADADCAAQEDGDLCNGTLYCDLAASVCVVNPATVVTCPEDAGACVQQVCQAKTGACAAQQAKDGAACDDGQPCTAGEFCDGGVCGYGVQVCQCASDADCAAKEDGDPCNGTLYCDAKVGACLVNPATVVTCAEPADPACQTNTCAKATGACVLAAKPAGAGCSDGDACTVGDACEDGACEAGGTLICPCFIDADCAKFENGDLCDGTLYCDKSNKVPACKVNPATVVACPQGQDTCTVQACVAQTGACAAAKAPDGSACDDGDPCTGPDGCAGGACGGVAVACADGDPCTSDGCVTAQGGCVFAAKGCDDGDACTIDGCDAVTGACTHAASGGPCDDGDACTVGDLCLSAGCHGQPLTCSDGDACTADACAGGACLHAALSAGACDDGDACTASDGCQGGACLGLPLAATACADGDACTVDGCHPLVGCLHALALGATCDDGDVCTVGDACAAAGCLGAPGGGGCDDGNPCTVDGCAAGLGCTHQAAQGACDDGDPCTKDDACSAGACVGAPAGCACQSDQDCKVMDDANLCNGVLRCDKSKLPYACALDLASVVVCPAGDGACAEAVCEPATGVCKQIVAADGSACHPGGKLCTAGACQAGACQGKGAVACDDGSACTVDLCDDGKGCLHSGAALEGKPCSDGKLCTKGETCQGGSCKGGQGGVCDDGNACTLDLCAEIGGCSQLKGALDGKPCDDGDACSASEACQAGVCQGGKAMVCDDGNACTLDLCQGGACKALPAPGACDDGDACTSGDGCSAGVCAGQALPCGDGNPCTVDFCLEGLGCVHDATTLEGKLCKHPSGCVVGALCKAGLCAGGDASACGDIGDCTVLPDAAYQLTGPSIGAAVVRYAADGAAWAGSANSQPPTWMLVRYDALGNQTLLKTYPQPKAGTTLGALLPMADGGVIVGGGENATPSQWQSWKTQLQRLDAQGGQVWLNPFTPTQGSVKALVRRPDGSNVAMAEPTSAIGSTYMAFTDAGKLLWLKSYKGSTSTYYVDRWIAADLLPASDGSVYAVGQLFNPAPSGTKDSRLALLRLNASGARLWNAYVDVGFAGRLYGVTDRQGGGVWAVGAGRPAAGAVWQPWLVEVDASGKVVGKTLLANGPTDHLAMSVLRDGDELTIASYVYDGQAAGNRPELRRMHRGGKLLWKRTYVVQDSDYPFQGALVHTPEGGYRLGGTARKKMGAGFVNSTLLIRTDPWGHAPCKATGKCAGKAKDACDDGDPKTADFCDAAAGCQHVAVP